MSEWIKVKTLLFKKEDFERAEIRQDFDYKKNKDINVSLVIHLKNEKVHIMPFGKAEFRSKLHKDYLDEAYDILCKLEKQLTYESGTKESEI